MPDREHFDIRPGNPVSDDVRETGDDQLARARHASKTSGSRMFPKQIDASFYRFGESRRGPDVPLGHVLKDFRHVAQRGPSRRTP